MVARLLLDFVRREWRPYLASVPAFSLLWVIGPVQRASDAAVIAVAMSMAFVLGPLRVEQFHRREIFMLPVSARGIWLAKWWLGTVGAVLWVSVTLVLATWHGAAARRGISLALLALLCAFTYTGAALALWTLLDLRPRGALWFRRMVIRGQMILWLLLALGGAFWSFALRPLLPTGVEQLFGLKGLTLLAGLALTVLAYLHRPAPGAPRQLARTQVETGSRRAPRARGAGRQPVPTVSPASSRLTGVAYLLYRDAIVALAYVAIIFGLEFLLALVSEPGRLIGEPAGGLSQAFDRAVEFISLSGRVADPGILLLLLISAFPAGFRWQRAIRHMRALPLSPMGLVALLIAVPLWRWLAFWSIGGALSALTARAPLSFHLDVLLAFTGIAALMHAVILRWSGGRPAVFAGVTTLAILILGVTIPSYEAVEDVAAYLGLTRTAYVGLVALASAITLNYHTLTRRTATYRPAIAIDAYAPGL